MMNKRTIWLRAGLLLLSLGTVAIALSWGAAPRGLTPRLSGPANAAPASGLTAPIFQTDGPGPLVIEAVQMDVSPPLRDIKPAVALQSLEIREMGEPGETTDAKLNPNERPQIVDPVLQSAFGDGPILAAPAPIVNFDGLTNVNGVYPPDTTGDVGPNHFVQWVNLSFQIFNKSGVSLYGPAAGNTLWSGFGGTCQTSNSGDPIVLYDAMADRWLMAQFTSSNPYGECIAISTTGDPTGSYYRYFFQFSTTVFWDYPHFGIWPDGYYMSANRFTGNTFNGPAMAVFDRARMLNGQTATAQQFTLGSSFGSLLPSDLDGATLPPTGQPNFVAEISTSALRLWKFHVDWVTPANSTFTGPTNLTVAAYNQICPTTRNCIPQPSTTRRLDAIGDRLMYRLVYRNFGTHEALVVNHSVNATSSGTRAGVRWYEVRDPNGAPSIYQQGTYSPDTTNRWMGSIAMDRDGNMAMVYSASSSSVFPSIRYTGRLAGDALGQMPQGENTLIAGSGSQTGTASRWGDYSMMTIDPVDDCTFWFTTEYIQTTGTASWKTRIGSFKFPSCGSGAPTATPSNTPIPPTATNTPVPPTATNTNTPVGPTNTPTNTPIPPTATHTPLPPTATNTPVSGQELIVNGGFEGSASSWTLSGNAYWSNGTYPHSGTGYLIMAYYNNASGTTYQQITVPSGSSPNLNFWLNVTSNETTTVTKYDYLYVEIRNTSGTLLQTLATYSNLDKSTAGNYVLRGAFNLGAYAGQTIRVQFRATSDASLTTTFRLDDVSVK